MIDGVQLPSPEDALGVPCPITEFEWGRPSFPDVPFGMLTFIDQPALAAATTAANGLGPLPALCGIGFMAARLGNLISDLVGLIVPVAVWLPDLQPLVLVSSPVLGIEELPF